MSKDSPGGRPQNLRKNVARRSTGYIRRASSAAISWLAPTSAASTNRRLTSTRPTVLASTVLQAGSRVLRVDGAEQIDERDGEGRSAADRCQSVRRPGDPGGHRDPGGGAPIAGAASPAASLDGCLGDTRRARGRMAASGRQPTSNVRCGRLASTASWKRRGTYDRVNLPAYGTDLGSPSQDEWIAGVMQASDFTFPAAGQVPISRVMPSADQASRTRTFRS